MLQRTLIFSFPVFSLIFGLLSVSAKNSIIYAKCSKLCFTTRTPYELNVNSLFTSIVNSASVSTFKKFTISPPGCLASDVVYGLFQCQGDLSNSDCRDCILTSVNQVATTCPRSTSGAIQLDGCFLKYDNTSFFGVEDKMEVSKSCGPPIIGYTSVTMNLIDDALAYLIVGNRQYFRAGGSGSVQGVAQCVEDLSLSECEDCILEARGRLRAECETSSWGDMYLGKCYIRYADGGFKPEKGSDNNNYNFNDNNYNYDYNYDGSKERKQSKRVKKMAITIGASVGGASVITAIVAGIIIYKKRAKRCH
ncbi:unnamed protein product [Lactuca saligna]|uniref:Gnk2-homologous domain-containing protein n=1 Tax=Lactuca saligna TaxID=75948 RepID=A0AA36EHY3_LACSI|nr:unnamed protein product [Lactuca saligna]